MSTSPSGVPGIATMTPQEMVEHDCILRTLSSLIAPLAQILPGDCEVVLHDLFLLPNSIVALEGSLTGRKVGGPATDLLLQAAARDQLKTLMGYTGKGSNGQELRSSTIIMETSSGKPVAALCINCDTRIWRTVSEIAATMLPAIVPGGDQIPEHFVGDVDDLAEDLLMKAINAVEVPVALMHKRHKKAVVAELKSSGFFILRESVERAAQALSVTRFTVYNYLKELDRDQGDPA
ncbi:MAG: PAS domain-containing protein [Propionibacteriaceae bacterium]|jgi:predicted transcriptional regulator YheO|nr:PAS domain-containing protein [Propionibacteriaceae bacterium]